MPILLAGGIGGTLYHATRVSVVYFLLDVIPISLLGLAGSLFMAFRYFGRRQLWILPAVVVLYIVCNRILFSAVGPISSQLRINLSYASLAVLVLTPVALVLIRTRFRHGGWVVAGLVSFVIAWFFRLVDRDIGHDRSPPRWAATGSGTPSARSPRCSSSSTSTWWKGRSQRSTGETRMSPSRRGETVATTAASHLVPEVSAMLTLAKYSIGVGDRFAHQAKAQLRACMLAAGRGVEVIPVWNKSNREHTIIGSEPASVRAAADAAVRELGWTKPYHVDADHIRLETVDRFLAACDFFTIDVADSIGQPATPDAVKAFVDRHPELVGRVAIPGIDEPFTIDAGGRRDESPAST